MLVDEYGAFRELDKDHWNQLEVLAGESFNLSSKNWGILLSKLAALQEQENDNQSGLIEQAKTLKTTLKEIKGQNSELLKSKESLEVSMEHLLIELENFSIPKELRKPGSPDFTISKDGINFLVEALKTTIGLRSRALLTQFLVSYNQKYTRAQILLKKIILLIEGIESESDSAVKKNKQVAVDRMKAILWGVEEFQDANSLMSLFQDEVEAFELKLKDHQQRIYKKAQKGHSTPDFTQLLDAFLGWLMEHIPNFAIVQVNINFLQQYLYQQGTKREASRIGRVAAEAGDINREAISSFSAAMVLKVHAYGVPLSGSKAKLFDFSSSYKFHKSIPDGKITKVKDLDKIASDRLIEMRGFVKVIDTFRDSSNKLISRLIMEESREGALYAVEAIFLHLKHEGIALGTYCHIQAFVRDPISFEGNKIPRLLIDKLSIKTKLIKQSWKVAFLDLSFPYYERWPNGLNLKFSLSPHQLDSDSAMHKLGAAELGLKSMVN